MLHNKKKYCVVTLRANYGSYTVQIYVKQFTRKALSIKFIFERNPTVEVLEISVIIGEFQKLLTCSKILHANFSFIIKFC